MHCWSMALLSGILSCSLMKAVFDVLEEPTSTSKQSHSIGSLNMSYCGDILVPGGQLELQKKPPVFKHGYKEGGLG